MHRQGLEAFAIYWLRFLFHFDRKAFLRELQFISKWIKKKSYFFAALLVQRCRASKVGAGREEHIQISCFRL